LFSPYVFDRPYKNADEPVSKLPPVLFNDIEPMLLAAEVSLSPESP
jgi:hypothetical protein